MVKNVSKMVKNDRFPNSGHLNNEYQVLSTIKSILRNQTNPSAVIFSNIYMNRLF